MQCHVALSFSSERHAGVQRSVERVCVQLGDHEVEGKVYTCGGRCNEENKMKRRCRESENTSVDSK